MARLKISGVSVSEAWANVGPCRLDCGVTVGVRSDGRAAAAARGPYGAVIASGWHTCALAGHALVTEYLSPVSSLPSPGIDEVRFHTPVRAGDTLTWWATVLVARASRSTPSRGIVRTLVEAVNQDGSLAASMTAINLMRRRPVAGT